MAEVTFSYQPLGIHHPFHRSSAYERCLFGAFGSGKTYAICAEAIAWCLEQPGIRGLIARKTVPELRDTTEPIFFEMLPPELYKAGEVKRSGGHAERFIFPNGSEVLFRSLDDWNKHRSLNVGFIAYDEANEIDEESYQGMASRVRQRDITQRATELGYTHEITRRGIWAATNPNGKDWLYTRFVDPAKKAAASEFFKSTSLDNPFLPPEYVDSLLQYPDPWVKRYVLCQFDDFAGQVYETWGHDSHVIKPYDKYPQDAAFWMGMDPGTTSRNPTAGLWVVVDRAKRALVAVSEYQEFDQSAAAHAKAWRAIEAQKKMKVSWRVADPNAVPVRDRGSNMKLSDIYRRLGYNFQPGPSRADIRIPMLGELIHTQRFLATEDCPQLYDQLLNYRWADITPAQRAKGINPPERPLKHNEHLVDCAQYLSSRWVKPDKFKWSDRNETAKQQFDREVQTAIHKKIMRNRKSKGQPSHGLGGIAV